MLHPELSPIREGTESPKRHLTPNLRSRGKNQKSNLKDSTGFSDDLDILKYIEESKNPS